MAYAVEADIIFLLGLDAADTTGVFTSANIILMMPYADRQVDRWIAELVAAGFSSPVAADLADSANHEAVSRLLRINESRKIRGVTHSGTIGTPAQNPEPMTSKLYRELAREIMRMGRIDSPVIISEYSDPYATEHWSDE